VAGWGGTRVEGYSTNLIFVNMPHRTPNCTNTLYDYAVINY